MADKKLLEEATIRRFMKLANITPSGKGVLKESEDRSQAGGRNLMTNPAGARSIYEEEMQGEEMYDEDMPMYEEEEADPMAGMDDAGMGGAEGGMEGGDVKAKVENLVNALNELLPELGMEDQEVELGGDEEGGEDEEGAEDEEGGEGEEGEEGAEDEEAVMGEGDDDQLEESIELVDDSLIEKLVARVSSRLVSEARKAKLAEAKKGGSGWGKSGMKVNAGKSKKSTVGHGAGKGKKAAPFSSAKPVKGIGGRGK